jgi:hypothetical protein
MPRPVRNVEYDDNKQWLVQSRADAVDAQTIDLDELPTSDPHVVDAIWNNAGTPTKSLG